MAILGKGTILVALASTAIALLIALQKPPPAPTFTPVDDAGLYMLTQWLRILPILPRLPVSVYLVQQSNSTSWGLIDAGLPDSPRQPHATQLLAAVRAAIPPGHQLTAIVLTHSHGDHIGGLPLLLEAYPEAPVVLYELEAPYLVPGEDGKAQRLVAPGTLLDRALRWAGMLAQQPVTVPAERARLLTEGLDSLAAHGLPDLDYVITLGHSPGHISIVHAPSRTMLAGDALTFVRPSMRLSNATADQGDPRVALAIRPWSQLPGITLRAEPQLVVPEASQGGDREKATTSACLLAFAFEFDRLLASHDWALARPGGGGWTPANLKAWAAANPACQQTLRLAEDLGWESAKEAGEAAPPAGRVQIKMGSEAPPEEEEEEDEYADSWEEEGDTAQPSRGVPGDDEEAEFEVAREQPLQAASEAAEAAAVAEE